MAFMTNNKCQQEAAKGLGWVDIGLLVFQNKLEPKDLVVATASQSTHTHAFVGIVALIPASTLIKDQRTSFMCALCALFFFPS